MSFSTATQVVFATVQEACPGDLPTFSLPMRIFQSVRKFFRYMRYGNIYTNSDNFLQLASGHLLNFAFGDSRYVQVAAQAVLIAHRILATIEQQKKVYRCYQKLCHQGHFPLLEEHVQKNLLGIFSPSSEIKFQITLQTLRLRISGTVYRIYRLAIELFKLGLALCDAVDSFSLSPAARAEAINHLFLNATQQLSYLAENGELLQKLHTERTIIDKVFVKMGSLCRTDQLIAALQPMARTAAAANQCVQGICRVGNGAFLQLMQEGVFGFMSVIGLSDLLPNSWVPALLLPPRETSGRVYGRYPDSDVLVLRICRASWQPLARPRTVDEVYEEILLG